MKITIKVKEKNCSVCSHAASWKGFARHCKALQKTFKKNFDLKSYGSDCDHFLMEGMKTKIMVEDEIKKEFEYDYKIF